MDSSGPWTKCMQLLLAFLVSSIMHYYREMGRIQHLLMGNVMHHGGYFLYIFYNLRCSTVHPVMKLYLDIA